MWSVDVSCPCSWTGSEDLIPPTQGQIEHGAAAVPMEMVAGADLSSNRKPCQVCAERRSPGHRGSTLGFPTAVPV